MQNDAKLGLLAGVVGVIIAATISGKQPSPPGTAGSSPQSTPVINSPVQANEAAAPAVVTGSTELRVKSQEAATD